MPQADKFKLCVSPITGDVYISTIAKDGNMSDNRKKLTQQEVLHFIVGWTVTSLENDQTERTITNSKGKPIIKISLIRENLECDGDL